MWFFKKKVKEEIKLEEQSEYNSESDNLRSYYISKIIEYVKEYFIPYNNVEYKGPENKNLLHYRMLEFRTFLMSKYKNGVIPVFLNNIRTYDTIVNFTINIKDMGDDNIYSLFDILDKYHKRRTKKDNN